MVALVENVPKLLPLREVIRNYIRHQREVIVRRVQARAARRSSARVHVLEGLLIALDNLDAVIALIRVVARPRHGAHRADGALRDDARSRPARSSTSACSS